MFKKFKSYHCIDYEENIIYYCRILDVDLENSNTKYLETVVYQLDLKTLEIIYDFMCFNLQDVNGTSTAFEYNGIYYTEITENHFDKIVTYYEKTIKKTI